MNRKGKPEALAAYKDAAKNTTSTSPAAIFGAMLKMNKQSQGIGCVSSSSGNPVSTASITAPARKIGLGSMSRSVPEAMALVAAVAGISAFSLA